MEERDLWDEEPVLSRRERLRREREDAYRRPVRSRLRITAAAALVVALAVWLVVSWVTSSPSSSETLPEPPAFTGEPRPPEDVSEVDELSGGGDDPEAQEQTMVTVHVAGAVDDPGVVELASGSRVQDAVNAAGGPAPDAALDGLNLAETAIDGSYIRVPTESELQEGPPGDPSSEHGGQVPTGEDDVGTVNINTADASTLEQLPGVGPALAERIIAHREEHGSFASVEELVGVRGIGPAILADVEDLVRW